MITFKSITVLKLIEEKLFNQTEDFEEDYYFIVNDIFFPIQEIFVFEGGIEVKNTSYDIDIEIKADEKDLIWKKEEK